jgi:hypothetical protein
MGPGIRAMPKHGTWGPWEGADIDLDYKYWTTTVCGRKSFREDRSAKTFTETILFLVDIHNPSTINNVSAYTTGLTVSPIEIVPKDICLPPALRIVSQKRLSVRQNLTYIELGDGDFCPPGWGSRPIMHGWIAWTPYDFYRR